MKEQDQLSKGGGDQKSKLHDVTLKTIGIEKIESQRWQRIAGIPEERFEEYLLNAKKSQRLEVRG
jgi:hypothetical protein